jgi:hypothetical protein
VLRAALSKLACTDVVPISAAKEETFSSVCTPSAPQRRRKISAAKIGDGEYASVHLCPGLGGIVVQRQEEDLRETASAGRSRAAAREPAA